MTPSRSRLLAGLATAATVGLLATGLGAPTASAAGRDTRDARDQARAALAAHPAATRTSPDDIFTARGSTLRDKDGSAHVRYDRSYRGVPVLGGDVVVHLAEDGSYDGSSLTLQRPLRLDPVAQVSRAAAVATANAAFEGTVSSTDARRVVDAIGSRPAAAWEVTLTGVRDDQTPSVLHVVVDGATGEVRRSADEVRTGTGYSKYSGTVSIATSGSSGAYKLSDPTRGGNNTTDLGGATIGNGTLFSDADDVWGNGSTTDRATAGVDAHYGSQVTFDYFKNVLGRNGIFNNGAGVRSRVHYGNAYNNAFWDGSQMTYGDGTGNTRPLTELDVAGHEMSHGVTENTANLTYSGESGGLNEATSDIFGTAVEFYANNAGRRRRLPDRREDRHQRQRDPAALHGQAEQGRRLGGLLVLRRRQPRCALLVRPGQPRLLPDVRGQRRQDDQRRQLQQPDLQRLHRDRHRPGRGGQDLVPRPQRLHDVLDELRRRAHRRRQGCDGPVRRQQQPVRRRRERLQRDQRRRHDLRHHAAAAGWQQDRQPGLRVRRDVLDPDVRRDQQRPDPGRTAGRGSAGWTGTAAPTRTRCRSP